MQNHSISAKLADMSVAAGRADRAFKAAALSLCREYEARTGLAAPVDMSDWEVQFRSATDKEFARLRRQVCALRLSLLGY